MNLDHLIAKKGEPIRPKFNALIAYVRSALRLTTGAGIRTRKGPDGTSIIADSQSGTTFAGAWRVRLSASTATVGAGTVNGLVPRLNGVRLDGTDGNGKPITVPPLKLTDSPGENLRSYIVLKVEVEEEKGTLIEEKLTIEHRSTLNKSVFSTIAYHPLAMIVWQDKKTPGRVVQNSYFPLQHAFTKAKDATPPRHLFFPG